MNVQIIKKTDFEISFLLDGVGYAFANALRRTMISEIPTLAIKWVDFIKNDSALQDEILANRLGQIPLTFDKNMYNLPENCKCEGKGCSRCQVKLSLSKTGPCVVYSEDLKSKNKDVRAVYEKIPIVELFENQCLELEAIAQLGIGRNHAKWQGAVVGYKNLPQIVVGSNCNACGKCVERCVRKILKIEDKKIKITNPMECNLCLQCVDFCPIGAIRVETKKDSFVFNVESVCGLNSEGVVFSAIETLEKKINDFAKSIRKIK